MCALTPEQLGVTGQDDEYHFKGDLNRVTITGENSEDYRLVLFFIKKGTRMPLHDHPNMSVFFRLVFGGLRYHSYDKLDSKFKDVCQKGKGHENFLQAQTVLQVCQKFSERRQNTEAYRTRTGPHRQKDTL